jgi:hypothetical protein
MMTTPSPACLRHGPGPNWTTSRPHRHTLTKVRGLGFAAADIAGQEQKKFSVFEKVVQKMT